MLYQDTSTTARMQRMIRVIRKKAAEYNLPEVVEGQHSAPAALEGNPLLHEGVLIKCASSKEAVQLKEAFLTGLGAINESLDGPENFIRTTHQAADGQDEYGVFMPEAMANQLLDAYKRQKTQTRFLAAVGQAISNANNQGQAR